MLFEAKQTADIVKFLYKIRVPSPITFSPITKKVKCYSEKLQDFKDIDIKPVPNLKILQRSQDIT